MTHLPKGAPSSLGGHRRILRDRQRLAALQQSGWRRVGMGRRGAVEAARAPKNLMGESCRTLLRGDRSAYL